MISTNNEAPSSSPHGYAAELSPVSTPQRILFLDMMRFVALVMMLQGHTVYQILDHEIREGGSSGIAIWRFFRGYTAPVFMTVAGTVFTYLLALAVVHSGDLITRLRFGLVRVATLFVWAYALRLPLGQLFVPMSQKKLDIGIAVDVLHLIGFGLLMIITVFLACRPLLRRSVGCVAGVFLLLFLICVQFSPMIAEHSFHRQVERTFSPGILGVTVSQGADEKGIEVREVIEGSRADELGLIAGDIITQIGLAEVTNIDLLPRAEAAQTYGKPSPIKLLRDGEQLEIDWAYERRASLFPNVFTFWMNRLPAPSGMVSQFPIFPWVGYLMFGASFGLVLAEMNRRQAIPLRLDLILFAISVALMTWGELAPKFGRIWLGGGDSAIVFQRLGGVMVLASLMVFLSHGIKKLPPLVIQMSRNSLWLYIGHLIILYNILPKIYREKFDVLGTLCGVVVMFVLMIAQTLVIEKKRKLGSWKSTFVFFVNSLRLNTAK